MGYYDVSYKQTENERRESRECQRNHREHWVVVQREGNALRPVLSPNHAADASLADSVSRRQLCLRFTSSMTPAYLRGLGHGQPRSTVPLSPSHGAIAPLIMDVLPRSPVAEIRNAVVVLAPHSMQHLLPWLARRQKRTSDRLVNAHVGPLPVFGEDHEPIASLVLRLLHQSAPCRRTRQTLHAPSVADLVISLELRQLKPRFCYGERSNRLHHECYFINGYHWTPSDYSLVRCNAPGCPRPPWRTKAAYVSTLPDARRAG